MGYNTSKAVPCSLYLMYSGRHVDKDLDNSHQLKMLENKFNPLNPGAFIVVFKRFVTV